MNDEYVKQSLLNQIANLAMQVAERDAVITELKQELDKNEVKNTNK
mgnify:CR=1 FL=1